MSSKFGDRKERKEVKRVKGIGENTEWKTEVTENGIRMENLEKYVERWKDKEEKVWIAGREVKGKMVGIGRESK